MGQSWDLVNLDKEDKWADRHPICNKLGSWFWDRDVMSAIDQLTERVDVSYRGWSASKNKVDVLAALAHTDSRLLKLPPELIRAIFGQLEYVSEVINLCLAHDYLGEIGEPEVEIRIRQLVAYWVNDHILCFGDYSEDDDLPPQVRPYVAAALQLPTLESTNVPGSANSQDTEGERAMDDQKAVNDQKAADYQKSPGELKAADEQNGVVDQKAVDDQAAADDDKAAGDQENTEESEHGDSENEEVQIPYTPPSTDFYYYCRTNYTRGYPLTNSNITQVIWIAYRKVSLKKSERKRLDDLLWHGIPKLVKMPPYRSRVLCNVTKGEYVRADAVDDLNTRLVENVNPDSEIAITLGQAMLSKICWSTDSSCAMSCDSDRLTRGPWAGDAFRVTTFDRWDPKKDTRSWRDVTDEVVQWLEELWKSSVSE